MTDCHALQLPLTLFIGYRSGPAKAGNTPRKSIDEGFRLAGVGGFFPARRGKFRNATATVSSRRKARRRQPGLIPGLEWLVGS